jgi:hypothetical protein
VSGSQYVNFGWALTPLPKMIPTDGSTITVFVDGAPVGTVAYDNPRPDIGALFPALLNSGGPVGFRFLNTTALANGVHTIAWVVSDNAGAAAGIGSRYFTVSNASPITAAPLDARVSLGTERAGLPPVQFRLGSKPNTGRMELKPMDDGRRFVVLDQLDRLELSFNDACGAVTAKQIANGESLPLPVGSTLDGSNRFFWQPGPAFLGTFRFEFSVPSCNGGRRIVPVDVTVTLAR